jgi:hypothetical protein
MITRKILADQFMGVVLALALGIGGFGVLAATPNVYASPLKPPLSQSIAVADTTSDPATGWKLLYTPPVPDLFSGATTFVYPLEVPAGRNSLQPKVNLVYSSRAIDGLLDTGAIDPGPIALGWSLNFIDIMREGVHEGGDGAHKVMYFPNQFSLLIDGTAYELQPDTTDASYGRYHAKDLPGYYIERHNDWDNTGAPNTSHEYWLVRTPDGTTARLGYTANSEQTMTWVICEDSTVYCGVPGEWYDWNDWYQVAANRWRVDVMTDTFNNTINFTYLEATKSYHNVPGYGDEWLYKFQQSRPAEITYNYGNGGWGSRLEFLHTTDADPTGQVINAIQVYNADALIRRYQVNQSWQWNNTCGLSVGTYVVDSIQMFDGTGTASFPATTLEYQPLEHRRGGCYQFSTLNRISNGYGAVTEFSYVTDGRQSGSMGQSYRVSEMLTYDGLNPSPARIQYAYGTRCYNQTNAAPAGSALCTGFGRIEPDGPLVGHDVVTRTVLDFNGTALSKDDHRYFIYSDNDPLRGRCKSTPARTPARLRTWAAC